MVTSRIITPKVVKGFVSRQTNLGIHSYDLEELYSPATELWKSKVLDLGSPKYPPQIATAPTRYIFDRSRYNNHGTITGAIWVRLPSGLWALNFDGSDDYIDCGGAASIVSITGDLTLECWLLADDAAGDEEVISTLQGKTDLTVPYHLFKAGANMDFRLANGTVQYWARFTPYPVAKWIHVVGEISGVTIDIYVNGVKGETGTFSGTRQTGTKLTIGDGNTAAIRPFDGRLALIRIYNIALPVGQIRTHYNQERHLLGV